MARGAHKSPQRTRRPKRMKSQNKLQKLLQQNQLVLNELKSTF